jgi:hypothetical protein
MAGTVAEVALTAVGVDSTVVAALMAEAVVAQERTAEVAEVAATEVAEVVPTAAA